MSFGHLAGVTDPGAPDEVVDWFATFESWITGIGWSVASGAGTTDMIIHSAGEAGGLTMLYVHLWRDGGNPNRVHLEVCDDGVPTHQTTRGGYVDSGGLQFDYWMSADLDAVVIAWKTGAGYRMVYGGLVYPFALTVPDETYHCIASNGLENGAILRRYDDLWDQDDSFYSNAQMGGTRALDSDDGSFAIGGVYFGDNAEIAGQLKHISGRIQHPAISPEDTLTTGQPGATTEWIVLEDHLPWKFAMRTGGVLPTGTGDGSFAHTTGNAADVAAFFAALVSFMQGLGWTATDISGTTGNYRDYEFHSSGEDTTSDIWVRMGATSAGTHPIFVMVADSAYGTPGRHETMFDYTGVEETHFPTEYYISGDKDCVVHTCNQAGSCSPTWAGKMLSYAPNLSNGYMHIGMFTQTAGRILLSHTGTWGTSGNNRAAPHGDGAQSLNSNPNNYDSTTYLVWPMLTIGASNLHGILKYYLTSHGNLAIFDTITVGARRYRVFCRLGSEWWAMRDV